MNRERRHSRTVTVAEYNALHHIARLASILARQVRSYSTALGSNHLSRTTSQSMFPWANWTVHRTVPPRKENRATAKSDEGDRRGQHQAMSDIPFFLIGLGLMFGSGFLAGCVVMAILMRRKVVTGEVGEEKGGKRAGG